MRLAVIALAACSQRAPIASCGQNLEGAYVAADGRWMVLDHGPTLEAYPLFDDAAPSGDLVIAPRVINLVRSGGFLDGRSSAAAGSAPEGERGMIDGEVLRRYMRRADRCEARARVRVTACHDDTLELVLGEVAPPLTLVPCTWPPRPPERVERWRKE